MYNKFKFALLCSTFASFTINKCASELLQSMYLALYGPNDLEYTEILIRKENDNLTLICELRGEVPEAAVPRTYIWNHVPSSNTSDDTDRPFKVVPPGATLMSTLIKENLQLSDTGHYWCSTPPFSVTKYVIVQTLGVTRCARGAFSCGVRCVLAPYVCDGRRDCARGEDEAAPHCAPALCDRSDRLNCSTGRCIPRGCCSGRDACHHQECCAENAHRLLPDVLPGLSEEFPHTFDDRRAPDEYGFIQSTIYTVTACALIFMIAVVFLVSAICKMHMKRTALRSYAHSQPHLYNVHIGQRARFPPCYEASRLLEAERAAGDVARPQHSPAHAAAADDECAADGAPDPAGDAAPDPAGDADGGRRRGFPLAALSAVFAPVYRQVPTECDVEMTDVRSASLNNSPARSRTRSRLDNYRSPTYCDLNTDVYFTNPELQETGRSLNTAAGTPLEVYRRRAREQRPLTLQLGRFQLSIPRFGRRPSEPRPDTPNVAEINIDDLDFVRLNSNETYTLNGRTIRLLGASFENYPVSGSRPPPYNEAIRYKLYGPPPEYLSRDALDNNGDVANNNTSSADEDARNNVEMPPRYEELAAGGNANSNNNNIINDVTTTNTANIFAAADVNSSAVVAEDNNNTPPTQTMSSVIDNLPAIDCDANANDAAAAGAVCLD